MDRQMNAAPGSNTYETHLDFNSYVSMFIHTMTSENASKQKELVLAHHMVMGYTLVPTEHYHTFMENYFEWDPIPVKQLCAHFCSYCLQDVSNFMKRVNKQYLISFLSSRVCVYGKTPSFFLFY